MNRLRSRARWLGALAAALGLAGTAAISGAGPADAARYCWTSSPDFNNSDVGDVTKSAFYRPGQPNSWGPAWQTSQGRILGALKAEGCRNVLVAGDLVEGHWGIDTAGTGTFGPVDTVDNQRKAVTRAGQLYYGQWRARFTSRDLTVHPAVGDHEIGDNPWKGSTYADFKRNNISVFKNVFAERLITPNGYTRRPSGPAAKTAYARWLNPHTYLITLDVFQKTSTDVIAKVDARQLAWVESQLKFARSEGAKWIIAQGHTPIVGPVRVDTPNSHHLMYVGGRSSALWKLFIKNKLDIYLAGEVHAVTLKRMDGITQVSHGGMFGWGQTNYLLAETNSDSTRLYLTSKKFRHTKPNTDAMWQTDVRKKPWANIIYDEKPYVAGKATLTHDNRIFDRTGNLTEYHPG